MNMRGEGAVLIEDIHDWLRDFTPSPAGDRVAFAKSDGLWIVPTNTGERRQITDFGMKPAWSPDGARIAFMSGDNELWLADVYGGKPRKIAWMEQPKTPTKPRGSYASAPRWSPDSRLLWFSLTHTEPTVPPKNLRERLWKDKAILMNRAEDREQVVTWSLEQAQWSHAHKTGIMDFGAGQAWSKTGYWTQTAWSPVAEYRF